MEFAEIEGDYQGFEPWPEETGRVVVGRVRGDVGIPTLQYYPDVEGPHIGHVYQTSWLDCNDAAVFGYFVPIVPTHVLDHFVFEFHAKVNCNEGR
jgi:hypothetical protein